MQIDTDFFEEFVGGCVFLEALQGVEMGVVDRRIICCRELDIFFDTCTPLVNATFNLSFISVVNIRKAVLVLTDASKSAIVSTGKGLKYWW